MLTLWSIFIVVLACSLAFLGIDRLTRPASGGDAAFNKIATTAIVIVGVIWLAGILFGFAPLIPLPHIR